MPLTIHVPITNDLNKINLVYGLYLQDSWKITEKLSVNFGSRWDRARASSLTASSSRQ